MKILAGFGKEIFATMFWVFLVLIIGFLLLSFLSNRVPILSGPAGWVEQHAQPQ